MPRTRDKSTKIVGFYRGVPISQAHGGGQIRRLLGWSPGLCLGRHGHQTTLGGARKTVDGKVDVELNGVPDVFTVSETRRWMLTSSSSLLGGFLNLHPMEVGFAMEKGWKAETHNCIEWQMIYGLLTYKIDGKGIWTYIWKGRWTCAKTHPGTFFPGLWTPIFEIQPVLMRTYWKGVPKRW